MHEKAFTVNSLFTTLLIIALGLSAQSPLMAAIKVDLLDKADARETAPTISYSNPDDSRPDPAAETFTIAEEKYAAGKTKVAKRLCNKITRRYPTSPFASRALALKAAIYKDAGKWEKSFQSLQNIVDGQPGYQEYDELINHQFDCATALMEGERSRILWIFPGFKKYGVAIGQFEQILENAPYNDLAPFSLMNIALLSEKTGETDTTIDALDRLINYYPQSTLAPDGYYNLARIYSSLVRGYQYDQGSTRRAISYYEDFLALFPNSKYTGEVEANLRKMENLLAKSRLDLGDFYYYYRSNTTAALVFYNEAITIDPDSDSAAEARLRIEDIEAGVRPVSKASIVRKLLGIR